MPEKPVIGRKIVLPPEATVAQAFDIIACNCFEHLTANQGAVGRGDREGIHRMRVGLRRLRAAISLFADLVRGPDTEAVKADLKWLTGRLAVARDLDVLVRGLRLRKTTPPDVARLRACLEARRRCAFAAAAAAVNGRRYRGMVLRIAAWLAAGRWRHSPARGAGTRPVKAFARDALHRRTRKIIRRAGMLDFLDARERHRLRIAAKKLRYATEFFESLYDGREYRKFQECLKALQDGLGGLHDSVVQEKLIARHMPAREKGATAGMAQLMERRRVQDRQCLAQSKKAAVRLSGARHFWR